MKDAGSSGKDDDLKQNNDVHGGSVEKNKDIGHNVHKDEDHFQKDKVNVHTIGVYWRNFTRSSVELQSGWPTMAIQYSVTTL